MTRMAPFVVIVAEGICSSSDPWHHAQPGMNRRRLSRQIAMAASDQLSPAWPQRA